MAQLAQSTHRLHPAKDLLDEFLFLLADRVSRVAGLPSLDGAGRFLRDMRRDLEGTQVGHQSPGVEALVRAEHAAWRDADFGHQEWHLALGGAGGGRRARVAHKAVAIVLEKHMPTWMRRTGFD